MIAVYPGGRLPRTKVTESDFSAYTAVFPLATASSNVSLASSFALI
jgi:hypothetical protein